MLSSHTQKSTTGLAARPSAGRAFTAFTTFPAFTALTVLFTSVLFTTALPAAAAEDWNQWRGPTRTGEATMFEVPATWPDSASQLWRVEVGEGQGAPVVANGKVYLMARQGEDEVAMALDLETGKTLWSQAFKTPYTMNQAAVAYGKGPRSTPVVAEGVACFLGVDSRLTCHDAETGKQLWIRDFSEQSSHEANFCGSALSPLVADGVLYAHLGDDRSGRLFAADLRTGKEKWAFSEEGPSYSSPLLIEIAGARQLVTLGAVDLLGFDIADGKLLWRYPFPTKYNENIVTPLQVGQRLVFADHENGTVAAWPTKTADPEQKTPWTLEVEWLEPELTQYMSSPVSDGEYLYGFSNRRKGQLFVADPATGKVLWQDEGRGGGNAFLALAGDWLLVATTDAELWVMRRKGSQLEKAKTYALADSAMWSHPAWLRDGLLVKDARHLARLSLTAPAPPKPRKSSASSPE